MAGLIQLPLLTLGVVSLIRASPVAYTTLQWGGALYLLWLGTKLLLTRRARHGPAAGVARPNYSVLAAAREGAICNLTNPAPWMFMIAFLPQFVDPARGSVAAQLFILGATQKLTGFVILGVFATASGALGNWLNQHPAIGRWQERVCGVTMIAIGLRVLIAGDVRNIRA